MFDIPNDVSKRLVRRANELGLKPQAFFSLLLDAALEAEIHQTITAELPECHSPRLFRHLVESEAIGIFIHEGEEVEDNPAVDRVQQVFNEEARRFDIDTAPEIDEFAIGRGADAGVIVLGIPLTVFALTRLVKNIDDNIPIIRRWIAFMQSVYKRTRASGYTATFLKTVCLEDAIRNGHLKEVPNAERVTATIARIDTGFAAAEPWGHYTITIPIVSDMAALVYIVAQDGEIIDQTRVKFPVSSESRDSGEIEF